MKKSLLFFFFLSLGFTGFSTTWTIVNSGFTFSPATLTIQEGDTVIFDLDNIHNSVEVSMANWNSNGTTPLAGGWSLPLGGGMVLPAMLEEGTHWYVCQPHASMGMKGMIIVEGTTSTGPEPTANVMSIYPNPTDGNIQLTIDGAQLNQEYQFEVFNMQGKRVYATLRSVQPQLETIDLSTLSDGFYFVKVFDGTSMFSRKLVIQ